MVHYWCSARVPGPLARDGERPQASGADTAAAPETPMLQPGATPAWGLAVVAWLRRARYEANRCKHEVPSAGRSARVSVYTAKICL